MAVIKARIPATGLARFQTNVIALSPDVEVVHQDETGVNVELSGPSERSIRSLLGTGARVGTPVHFRQHTKINKQGENVAIPGVHGEGVENHINEDSKIMDVQGGTLSVADLSRKPNR